jgi:hypothetical protein
VRQVKHVTHLQHINTSSLATCSRIFNAEYLEPAWQEDTYPWPGARHIRGQIFGVYPLILYQFAYEPGKSLETALHYAVTHIVAMEQKWLCLEPS